MSRIDCICNRNIGIIASYLKSRHGHFDGLFHDLPYPTDRFRSPEDFFLNEDEWTTMDTFHRIFRKAKDLSGEDYFAFNCGASSAVLRSWGKFDNFVRIFASPDEGFKRLPFFNSNINDTKDIEIICPPTYDKALGKMRVILKVRYHEDIDVEKDFICDAYRRGIVSSIPTIWGLTPAYIEQPLNQYDPVKLLNKAPEFACFNLAPRVKDGFLEIILPENDAYVVVGKKIHMKPEIIDSKKVYLGKYSDPQEYGLNEAKNGNQAILITETIRIDDRIILKDGEIFKAPYFILDVTYDKLSRLNRLSHIFGSIRKKEDTGQNLIDTINELRDTVKARNKAYQNERITNAELLEAKRKLEEYNQTLEKKVDIRTAELTKAKEELLNLNHDLERQVKEKAEELGRYNDLRRYLSPKLTEKILSSGDTLGAEPKRKMMTVMFSDIRSFSTVTDSLEPEELFHLMNEYISEMTKLIHQYEGTLNKIIGDGLLVFFGDPIPMEDHAQRAVLMAIEMQRKIQELKKDWLHYGHELGVGIGINTGYMTVGNIGSDMHMDYTVLGNQVNVAARLESKAEAGQILISQRTYSRVKGLVETDSMESINVKGIHQPVTVYNVSLA